MRVSQSHLRVRDRADGPGLRRHLSALASVSYYVNAVAAPGTTGITVATGTTATVTATPMTGAKQVLGPGLSPTIGGTVGGGRVESVVDNLDGSYTIGVSWSGRARRPVLNLDIGGVRMKIPIVERKPPPRKQQSG